MRLLVTGSREWPGSWEDIAVELPEVDDLTVIHGACSRTARKCVGRRLGVQEYADVEVSVDMLVDFAARGLGHQVERHPADWSLGRKAGPLRNDRMLREGKPDRGLAFGDLWKCELSRVQGVTWRWKRSGTGDMVSKMLDAGLPVRWVSAPGEPAQDLTAMPTPPVAT